MEESVGLVIGISIGIVIGVLLAIPAVYCIRYQKKHAQKKSSGSRRTATLPIRTNGADTCTILSDSTVGPGSPPRNPKNGMSLWFDGFRRSDVVAASSIPRYCYKDLQKATQNFTTLIGQGAFGVVYKAHMSNGDTVAVKVKLLGRLHHRNLLNLVGYCGEKGKYMLIYDYMSNGSLASHLYDEKMETLSWDSRVHIALDVARGLEYLHDGVLPPVIHQDIKSSNILLDDSMRARVADFGLSREELVNGHVCNLKGTFGYLDPEYISSRTLTKKSDVYSYGVLLFELIAGRNPLQGLMDYVELAATNSEGGTEWEEIADSKMEGKFNEGELNEVAMLAYKCVNREPKKRPSMRDIVQALFWLLKSRCSKKRNRRSLPVTPYEDAEEVVVAVDVEQVGFFPFEGNQHLKEGSDKTLNPRPFGREIE